MAEITRNKEGMLSIKCLC